ncbi:MAG: FliM/FliN family flagellar motor switch protein [Deltaproteobacteria bacterium]|nr:FliM/FliN family flagellar motor switch protein [Deltaproteobacteria bacterium]
MVKKTDDPYLSELESSMEELDKEFLEEATSVDIPEEPTVPSTPKAKTHAPVSKEALTLSPDVPISLVAVMARKAITMKDLLNLQLGQVVEFDKSPTDAVDVVVGGKVIAKAELVQVEGKLGIRILKVI